MSIKMMMVLGLAPSDAAAAAAPQIPGMIPLCEESSI